MTAPIDSFDLYNAAGIRLGRIDGAIGPRGEPVVRIVMADGHLLCQLSAGEVPRLGKLIAALKGARP